MYLSIPNLTSSLMKISAFCIELPLSVLNFPEKTISFPASTVAGIGFNTRIVGVCANTLGIISPIIATARMEMMIIFTPIQIVCFS